MFNCIISIVSSILTYEPACLLSKAVDTHLNLQMCLLKRISIIVLFQAWSYPSYEFSYSVNDPHTHDKKGQEETRNGDEVKGEYWLIEPDGRKRTVTYHADKHSGLV